MNMSLTAKMALCFSVLLTMCIGFTVYVAIFFENSRLTLTMALFSIMVIALFVAFKITLKKHMLSFLIQLSDVISALIDGRENEAFSVLNDELLSKLQAQVTKLSRILVAQNNRLKKDRDDIKSLISDISHQLKTPLANLRVYFDLLQDQSMTSAQREEFMQTMQGQLDKLSFLMDSIIKMSRLESGVIQLNPQMVSLNETSLTAIRQVYQKAQAKNIQLSFDEGQDIQLQHDSNWTTEAIFNLLDNAVKYTPSGGSVNVSLEKYEFFARLDITDTGSGLDEVEINQIFKRFYRGENARHQEGIGIGLYLLREIIQQQGGYIKVRSKKDEGSTFSLFLPLN
ncbi:MAG TPA: HAMP domain-containing sensor histidine kinase [Desulfosporosinus sp.]|nr:HAMP domain-containing sensor histidine kinase [Desulfosporosinus sp.]